MSIHCSYNLVDIRELIIKEITCFSLCFYHLKTLYSKNDCKITKKNYNNLNFE